MSTPSILGLDGGSLARRMQPIDDDAPTLTMSAVGDDPSVLEWTVGQWELVYDRGGVFARASVTEYDRLGSDHDGNTWHALCHVAHATDPLNGWFDTAEAGRAAVEEHIAARVEAQTEVSR